MPKSNEKKRRQSSSSESSGVDDPQPVKKQKKTDPPQKTRENNEVSWNLGPNKILKIREFKGKIYIDIREYYNDASGDLKPTKKGVSLSTEMYQKLKGLITDIDEELKKY